MASPIRIRKPMPLRGLMTAKPPDGLEPGYTPNCMNVHFRFGEAVPRPGTMTVGPVGDKPVVWIGYFLDGSVKWPIVITSEKIFKRGNLAPCDPAAWLEITGEGFYAAGSMGSVAAGEDCFFFTVGGSIYKVSDDVTTYEDITISEGIGIWYNDIPAGQYVEYFNNRLMVAYTTELTGPFPYRLRWPESGDYTKWDDTLGEGAGYVDIYDGLGAALTGVKSLIGKMAVYKAHAIMDCVPTGLVDAPHTIQLRIDGIGCAAPYTLRSNGTQHFFMAYDRNVYSWDGIRLDPIGDPILDELQGATKTSSLASYYGAVLPHRGEYWLIVDGGAVFVYDYRLGIWTRDSFPDIVAVGEVEDVGAAYTWNTISGTWQQLSSKMWDYLGATPYTTIYGGRSDGAMFRADEQYADDYFSIGSIVDRYLETPDYYFPSEGLTDDPWQMGRLLNVMLVYEYIDDEPFEAGVSLDHGKTWHTENVVPSANGYSQISFNLTGNVVRFRFRENNATGRFRWRHFAYEFVDAGPWRGSA